MDAYEATRIVFSRIQSLDPENASKIMGLLLIQDHGEKEMIRLAFGPESLLHSVVLKARKDLGLSPSTPSTPSSPSPYFSISRHNSSSRMLTNLSPLSSSWAPSSFSDLINHDDLVSPNSTSDATNTNTNTASASDLIDELHLQDQLSFLNDAAATTIGPKNSDLFYPPPDPATSPGTNSDGMLFPSFSANWGNNGIHRRSCSVTDICMGSDPLGSGLGWKPCLYFARGYCKNGTSCRFLHGLPDSADAIVGSPGKLDVMEQCQELLLRSKTQQQQLRLSTASQLMASATFPYTTATAGKCMNFLLQQQQNDTQRAAAAALMLGEDVHKFGRTRMERNEFSSSGGGMVNPGSRQIYLTFPADSTFREEDVSNYFSIYGPVQDVRIPYQQKRMFGFVTFVYPETVKLILAKGNPHFVCDARVLVKPYKEKGKVPDKYRKQQQTERGEFAACTTTGLDSRDPYDLQQLGGARMFNNTQEVLLRRKLEEQTDLQQAIELQGRRLMGLQLLDVKKHHYHHQHSLSTGAAPIPSPTQLYSPHINHTLILPSSSSDRSSPESPQENFMNPATTVSLAAAVLDQQPQQQGVVNANNNGNRDVDGKGESPNQNDCDFHNSLEHNLPDSPFASPTKSGGDPSSFTPTASEAERNSSSFSSSSSSSSSVTSNNNNNNNNRTATTPTLDMASFKSCFFQIPRFSAGHGAIGM